MNAYYNEYDPFAAEWLRGLIREGLITPGFVDERDVQDVQPADLAGYERHHFFAGIGGWDYALQLAGWDGPVWTGSCPCQPFSSAGKGAGFNDSRHLWPAWFRLIRECKPPVVFGEQVASADGLAWFDTVSTDLEAEGYAIGAADLPAASVGAPHRRQRLFFVANAEGEGLEGRCNRGRWLKTCGRGLLPAGPVQRAWPPGPGAVHLIPVLADGVSDRVGGCSGYGNAIVPQVAAEFIAAYGEIA